MRDSSRGEVRGLNPPYLYENVATTLDWPRLDETPELCVRYAPSPASSADGSGPLDMALVEPGTESVGTAVGPCLLRTSYSTEPREDSRLLFPTSYEPVRVSSRTTSLQSLGSLEPSTGLLGRAGTVLVRRSDEGAEWLQVKYRALDDWPSLYPLKFAVLVPSELDPLGNAQVSAVEAAGTVELRVPVPQNGYSVLDAQLRVSRLSTGNAQRLAAALIIESIGFESDR